MRTYRRLDLVLVDLDLLVQDKWYVRNRVLAPKRSSTLAQAVKTLATLGYSLPLSPVGADHDSMGRPLYGETGPSGIPPPGPAVLAPRRSPLRRRRLRSTAPLSVKGRSRWSYDSFE